MRRTRGTTIILHQRTSSYLIIALEHQTGNANQKTKLILPRLVGQGKARRNFLLRRRWSLMRPHPLMSFAGTAGQHWAYKLLQHIAAGRSSFAMWRKHVLGGKLQERRLLTLHSLGSVGHVWKNEFKMTANSVDFSSWIGVAFDLGNR